jgi:hypothetical protein
VNRTPDTKIFSLLLYRLSYLPTGTASVGLDGGLNSYLSGMSLATAVELQVPSGGYSEDSTWGLPVLARVNA